MLLLFYLSSCIIIFLLRYSCCLLLQFPTSSDSPTPISFSLFTSLYLQTSYLYNFFMFHFYNSEIVLFFHYFRGLVKDVKIQKHCNIWAVKNVHFYELPLCYSFFFFFNLFSFQFHGSLSWSHPHYSYQGVSLRRLHGWYHQIFLVILGVFVDPFFLARYILGRV